MCSWAHFHRASPCGDQAILCDSIAEGHFVVGMQANSDGSQEVGEGAREGQGWDLSVIA